MESISAWPYVIKILTSTSWNVCYDNNMAGPFGLIPWFEISSIFSISKVSFFINGRIVEKFSIKRKDFNPDETWNLKSK